MNADTREVARHQKFVQLHGTSNRFYEDDDLSMSFSIWNRQLMNRRTNLIEFQSIQQVVQLPIFRSLIQFNIMLLESVERKLGLVVNENFERLVETISTRLKKPLKDY